MRAAGKLAAEVLNHAGSLVRPGVTTEEIDAAVHAMIVAAGAYPSPLNYGGFPKSVCTSLNECICHGIPDSTVLQDGDIVNIDVTVFLDGHHGDTSRTFLVGTVDAEAQRLVDVTRQALAAAIRICRPGVPFKEIGATIHALADRHKVSTVPAFVGHGVGREFHSGPTVIHCRNNEPGVMAVGQTFTIEPMLTLGNPRERFWADEWTAVTADGSWSAQFEHTLLIVPGGVEVLTMAEGTPAVEGLPAPEEMAAAAAQHAAAQAAAPRRAGSGAQGGGGAGGRPQTGRKGKK
jgi:methionyl aminopeptidase